VSTPVEGVDGPPGVLGPVGVVGSDGESLTPPHAAMTTLHSASAVGISLTSSDIAAATLLQGIGRQSAEEQ
jgi:hypothetical protein